MAAAHAAHDEACTDSSTAPTLVLALVLEDELVSGSGSLCEMTSATYVSPCMLQQPWCLMLNGSLEACAGSRPLGYTWLDLRHK